MGYHWRDDKQGSLLRFNAKGVGSITKVGDVWRWQLHGRKRVFEGTTTNPERQKLWMTRWLSARTGIPVEDILRPRED